MVDRIAVRLTRVRLFVRFELVSVSGLEIADSAAERLGILVIHSHVIPKIS